MIALLQNITFVRGRVAEGWVQPEIHLFGVQLRASYVMLSLLTSCVGDISVSIYLLFALLYSCTFTSINNFYEKVQGKLSTHVKYILNTKQIVNCIELNIIIILGTNNVLQSLIFHARS